MNGAITKAEVLKMLEGLEDNEEITVDCLNPLKGDEVQHSYWRFRLRSSGWKRP